LPASPARARHTSAASSLAIAGALYVPMIIRDYGPDAAMY